MKKYTQEEMVAAFGSLVMWMRSQAQATAEMIESSGCYPLPGGKLPVDEVAGLLPELSDKQKQYVRDVADQSVDRFIQSLLAALSSLGTDIKLNAETSARIVMCLELIHGDSPKPYDLVVLNRGGTVPFSNNWGKWLNAAFKAKAGGTSECRPPHLFSDDGA